MEVFRKVQKKAACNHEHECGGHFVFRFAQTPLVNAFITDQVTVYALLAA